MTPYPRILFDSINLAMIDEFIARQQEEHLHLDFKQAESSMTKPDDKKNLAKALSGFANADGGVIVWGVDASPNTDGIDCAHTKNPIKQLSQFVSRLSELTGAAVNPLVDGVVHKRLDSGNGSGFAVTYVPASDSVPHMAKLGEDRYYKRSGSRFARMEHFDLEDMFGRRQRPVLTVGFHLFYSITDSNNYHIQIVLSIKNSGRGSAKNPYLKITAPENHQVTPGGIAQGRVEWTLLRSFVRGNQSTREFFGTADLLIHPGTSFEVARINSTLPHGVRNFPDLSVVCEVAAENVPLHQQVLDIPGGEVIDVVKHLQ